MDELQAKEQELSSEIEKLQVFEEFLDTAASRDPTFFEIPRPEDRVKEFMNHYKMVLRQSKMLTKEEDKFNNRKQAQTKNELDMLSDQQMKSIKLSSDIYQSKTQIDKLKLNLNRLNDYIDAQIHNSQEKTKSLCRL